MKKTTTLLLIAFSAFANAQFFEGFESGVPGVMEQSFISGNTTFIDFGISALNVDNALSETNSAVFYNAMETNEVSTSLTTPILDLSDTDLSLEFKYFQNQKTENYANLLSVELSKDAGVSWQQITTCNQTGTDILLKHIDLANYNPTSTSIIRFNCTQHNSFMGFPIAIDDISIDYHNALSYNTSKKAKSNASNSEITIYPNPSNGLFTISTTQPVEVTVTDSNGRIVASINEIESETTINLSQCASGIYFAKIYSTNNQETKKIIIK